MTVYVDDARHWAVGGVRHSYVSADSLAELHAFAGLLGLVGYTRGHYPVNETERALVLAAGAQAVHPRELREIAVCAVRNTVCVS